MMEAMAPWLYQYGLGLLILVLGIIAGHRNGVWARPSGRRWLALVVGGWVVFATAQGLLQYWGSG